MAEIGYAARVRLPYAIERGRAHLLRCPIERSGTVVAPTSGTFSLVDPAGTAVIDAQTVTITSSVAQYSVPAQPNSDYGSGWLAVWKLTMPDDVVHTFSIGAALCIAGWFSVVTDSDVIRRSSALNPSGAGKITSLTTFQDYIDDAGETLQRLLLEGGKRPWLILDGTELFEAHLALTLALVYEDLSTRNFAQYGDTATRFRNQYRDAWSNVKLTYDPSCSGQVTGGPGVSSGASVAPAAVGSWWTGGRR